MAGSNALSLPTRPIIDSTAAPHGKGDTRAEPRATGIGRGTIVLLVNAAGEPVGYRWSEWLRSKEHTTNVALLRLKDEAEPSR